jgi:hypothetical protein
LFSYVLLKNASIETPFKSRKTKICDHLKPKNLNTDILRSQHSVDGIATGYRLDDRGVGVPNPGRTKKFLFCTLFRLALGPTQLPLHWVLGALLPGVKW